MRWTLILFLPAVLATAAWSQAPTRPAPKKFDAAKNLFASYVTLENTYDTQLADLYSKHALIKYIERRPNGEVSKRTVPGLMYKQMIEQAMPIAEESGDQSVYSDVKYFEEGAGVRIVANKKTKLKKFTGRFELLVKPTKFGYWRIFEEVAEHTASSGP
jgi:hypothetical protein